jgi:hypothetical protein
MLLRSVPLMLLGLLCVSPNAATGDQWMVTDELPAALRESGVQSQQILTADEAHQVRGDFIPSHGIVITLAGTSNYVPNAATSFLLSGGGQKVSIGVMQGTLFFATEGMAVLGDYSPVRGVVATQSSNFTGILTFEGTPTSADVVALPGLFSIQLR